MDFRCHLPWRKKAYDAMFTKERLAVNGSLDLLTDLNVLNGNWLKVMSSQENDGKIVYFKTSCVQVTDRDNK